MTYLDHLKKDKKLAKILPATPFVLEGRKNIPLRLCSSIMSQQLSTKVAKVIFDRFLALFPNQNPKPADIAALSVETLRSIGLSNAKAQYVLNVAAFCEEHNVTDRRLKTMENEEIIDLLTQIKGVGQWTVEMLLMFTLGREDVFAVDDYGIQVAMKKLYKIGEVSKKELRETMLKISTKWSPYRTYACMHLWGWKDGEN